MSKAAEIQTLRGLGPARLWYGKYVLGQMEHHFHCKEPADYADCEINFNLLLWFSYLRRSKWTTANWAEPT